MKPSHPQYGIVRVTFILVASLSTLVVTAVIGWFVLKQSGFFDKPTAPSEAVEQHSTQPEPADEKGLAETSPPPRVRFEKPGSEESATPDAPRRSPFTYRYFVDNPLLAPAEVTLYPAITLPLRRGTETIGEVSLPAESVVRVQSIRPDHRLLVQGGGRTFLVNVGETDFVERAQAHDAPDAPWPEGESFSSVLERFQFQESQLTADEQQFIQDYEKWALQNNWIINIQIQDQVIRATADTRAFDPDNPEALRRMAALLAKAYVIQSKEAGTPHHYAECILIHPVSGQILDRMSFHEP